MVNADEKKAFSDLKNHEKNIEHLYKDNDGFITVGFGHRVYSLDEAKSMNLYIHDTNDNPVRPATKREIEEIYTKVENKKHGQNVIAKDYSPKKLSHVKNIRLRDSDIDTLLNFDIRKRVQFLRRNWDNFDNYPDQLQRALLDLEFNSGSVTPHTWPKLNKAIQAKDWNSIAKEMHLDTENKKRNIHRENLIKEIQKNQQQ